VTYITSGSFGWNTTGLTIAPLSSCHGSIRQHRPPSVLRYTPDMSDEQNIRFGSCGEADARPFSLVRRHTTGGQHRRNQDESEMSGSWRVPRTHPMQRGYFSIPRSSTSKISAAFGPMTAPEPRSPYASLAGMTRRYLLPTVIN